METPAHSHSLSHTHSFSFPLCPPPQVMTGVPPTEPLFNGSLCSTATGVPSFDAATHFGGPLAGQGADGGDVEVAVPIALDRPTPLSGTAHSRVDRRRRAVHPHDALFLTSRGTVTSYGPHGELNWQTSTPASWDVRPAWEEVGAAVPPPYASAGEDGRMGGIFARRLMPHFPPPPPVEPSPPCSPRSVRYP